MSLYNREPLEVVNGIPVFSSSDEYIENYDLISNDHLDYLAEHGENPFMSEDYWKSLEDVTIGQVKRYAKKGDKVLDIGVGLGRLLSGIDMDVEKYGVDISMRYLLEARKQNINVCLAKIEELPYPDNFFDVVVSTDVLEHVLELHECVTQILRVLKPGGTIVIRVPYREDLSAYLTFDKYKFVHIRNFDKASLQVFFTKFFKTTYVESDLVGIIKSPQRYKFPIKDQSFQIYFFENLLHFYRLNRYHNKNMREYCAEVLTEYKKYNFTFKNYFLVNQFFKIVYYILERIDRNYIYKDTDIYNHIEISMVFRKDA